MDYTKYSQSDSSSAKTDENDWSAWVSENVLKPAYNGSVVQTANTVSNAINFAARSPVVGRMDVLEVQHPQSLTQEMTQSFSGAVGMILPYAAAGKAASGLMRGGGRTMAIKGLMAADGIAARTLGSEVAGQVAGAAFIDAFRDRRQGETVLGNVAGGMAAFGAFGYGNSLMRGRPMSIGEKLIARAAVGVVGAEMQLGISKGLSGEAISAQEMRMAAMHGAVLNIGLPIVHERVLGPAADYVNAKLGRGVSVERYATINDLHGQSKLLADLMRENPLMRVTAEPQGPAMVDHKGMKISVTGEGNKAAEVGHELSHSSSKSAAAAEPGFIRAKDLLAAGSFHEAKAVYLETRRNQERQAIAAERQIAAETEATQARLEGRPAPLSPAGSKEQIALNPAYDAKFRNEWATFVETNGRFRPAVDYSLPPAADFIPVLEAKAKGFGGLKTLYEQSRNPAELNKLLDFLLAKDARWKGLQTGEQADLCTQLAQELKTKFGEGEKPARVAPLMELNETPELLAAETAAAMKAAARGKEPLDILGMIEEAHFQRGKLRDGMALADALSQTNFYKQNKDYITDAEVVAEGGEAVIIRLKGPFILAETAGGAPLRLEQMALKISQPLRGEWHEHWGNWEERPWDALLVGREQVTVAGSDYHVYLQELVIPGISPAHQKRFETMLRRWNKQYAASRDDHYELWDTDARGDATKQFGYSSLPVQPGLTEGSVWAVVDGKRVRVVLTDPWAVCKYGEDGQKE